MWDKIIRFMTIALQRHRGATQKEGRMILEQYYLGCLAHASYLIADEGTRTAVVVDPQRDIDRYLKDTESRGLEICHVFLTHSHADFIAGHLELRDRFGAKIHLGAGAKAEFEFTPMRDRDLLEFGEVRLEILETPGHSPDSISILVYDLKRDAHKPHAVLTGDTLFIGDVGRPDLRASLGWSATELGGMLYDSLHQKLMGLPDETLVYPAHGAGSMCGKNLSEDTFSTIGTQRHYNYALQPMSKEAFIRIVTAEQPDAPSYFKYDAILNMKERPTLEQTLRKNLKPLGLSEVLRMRDEGAVLLDVRDPVEFEGAHLADSINIGLGGKYATWAGTILEQDKGIVVIAEMGREEEAGVRLGRIGFDNMASYLEGGMQALEPYPELVKRTERISPVNLAEKLRSEKAPVVIDVRTRKEWESRRIEGSTNIPLNRLQDAIREHPLGGEVVVHCESGYRSSIAASLLEREKVEGVSELVGGMAGWEAANLPIIASTEP